MRTREMVNRKPGNVQWSHVARPAVVGSPSRVARRIPVAGKTVRRSNSGAARRSGLLQHRSDYQVPSVLARTAWGYIESDRRDSSLRTVFRDPDGYLQTARGARRRTAARSRTVTNGTRVLTLLVLST